MVECKFTLELTKNGVQKTIYAKSGEFNSRKVVITLTESGKVFDSHLYVYRVYCQEENSTAVPKYWDEIRVVNGCIEFTLPDEWLTAGDKVCELKVYSGTESLFSPLFRIIVAQSLGGGAEAVPTGKDVRYQEALPDLPEGSAEEGGEVAVFNPEENQVRRVKLSEIVVDETDPTVPAWAKQANPPSYTAEDVGALPVDTFIPTRVSQLSNDSNYQSESEVDSKDAVVIAKIPTKVSQLTNDSKYLTEGEVVAKIPTRVSQLSNDNGYALKEEIPTKMSQLTNDESYTSEAQVDSKNNEVKDLIPAKATTFGYDILTGKAVLYNSKGERLMEISLPYIPKNVGSFTNDAGYAKETEVASRDEAVLAKIPTKVSQLDNDSGYVSEGAVPNKAEVNDSVLKFKRDDTELFEVELPAGGGEGGLASIPVADSDTLGGVKIPNNSEIKVDSSGNIGMNYGNLDGYSISAVLATSLLYDEGAGIRTNISATLEEANSFVQNFIFDLLLENFSALALTVFESGDLIYLDENYEEKTIKVSPNAVYVFKLVDYVVTVKSYEGNELRKLIVEGI